MKTVSLNRRQVLFAGLSVTGLTLAAGSGLLGAAEKAKKLDCSKTCREFAEECESCKICCRKDRLECSKQCEMCQYMCLTCAVACEQKHALAEETCVLCEKMCRACAAECMKHNMPCCQECAKKCLACAEACKAARA